MSRLSYEKVISRFSAVFGSCVVDEVYRGGLDGFRAKVSDPFKAVTPGGYFLVTAPYLEGEEIALFFPATCEYEAYVKCYRVADSLPTGLIIRRFKPVTFRAVTDDDTLLPTHLKVSFVKTTEPTQEFWDSFVGCVTYALTETFRGKVSKAEFSSADFDVDNHWWNCELTLELDGSNAKTEHPDLGLAISTARFYLERGTPLRTTDRAGAGTKGTRAVGPVSDLKGVKLYWELAS